MSNTDILFDLIDLYMQKNEMYSIQGTVKSVNESERTCVVTPTSGGSDVLDVRLESEYTDGQNTDPKGFFVVPKVGSIVGITFMSKEDAFVSIWSEIDKTIYKSGEFIFNDGSNGGLTITPELKTQLDKTNELLQSLIDIISGTPINEPGNGAPSALQAALNAAITGKSLGEYDNIENEKVKH